MTPNPADEAFQVDQFEAAPGPAQFKLRTPEAMLYVWQLKLRARAIWSQRWQIFASFGQRVRGAC
eukprot:7479713-Alexandrium_andersonii.AAC.1